MGRKRAATRRRELTAILGMGDTGLACAEFLRARGESFVLLDTRAAPPRLPELRARFAGVPMVTGGFDPSLVGRAGRLVVSPGVDPRAEVIRRARREGAEITGDIDLFAAAVRGRVVAVTGSNGKSTVSALVGAMAARALGHDAVRVGGNFGPPALELLKEGSAEFFVLELSSFQLELCEHLAPDVACLLNITPEHLDRHGDLDWYRRLKLRVFRRARALVFNRDDPLTRPPAGRRASSFGLDEPGPGEFGRRRDAEGHHWLAQGEELLLPAASLGLPGAHNQANALAALAVGQALGFPRASTLETLREFSILPHRCEPVGQVAGVHYTNDSKATNPAATLASLEALARPGQGIHLIAGGEGKGADFSRLSDALAGLAGLYLFGAATEEFAAAAPATLPCHRADNLPQAVTMAAARAHPGDLVLLSPGCSSLDMFADYAERGEAFRRAVRGLS